MSNIDFIISLVLFLTALSLLAYLVYSATKPILSLFRTFKETSKIKVASQRLASVEKLLNDDEVTKALDILRKTFLFDRFQTQPALLALTTHHQETLSKCINAAEQLGGRLENLADVEKILLQRSEMLSIYNKAIYSFESLKLKRTNEGKKVPSWSKEEYKTRVAQIKQELSRNEKSLEEEINKLFMFLKKRSQENIVYH